MGIPRVSRPWLGTGRYKLGKGTQKRREMIVCFITHLIKHGSADHRRKQKPFCLDRLSTPIKACAAVFLGGPSLPDSANILSSSRTRTIITTRAIDHRTARLAATLRTSRSPTYMLATLRNIFVSTERTERTEWTARARLVDAKTSEISGHLTRQLLGSSSFGRNRSISSNGERAG